MSEWVATLYMFQPGDDTLQVALVIGDSYH